MPQSELPPNSDIKTEQERMIAEMLADWFIQIHSDNPIEQQQARKQYQQWQEQHPEYAYISKKMEESFAQMQLLQQQPNRHKQLIQPLFKAKNRSRKQIAKYSLLILTGFMPILLYFQYNSTRYLFADVRSHTGEWHTEILDDGTYITLKNKTAFNIRYSKDQRTIELITGEILVNVAPDKKRPFTILVEQGAIQALGTKFSVEYQTDHTDLMMLESKVRIDSSASTIDKDRVKARQVKAGERVYLTQYGIQTMPNIDIQNIEYEWKNRTLVAEEQSLVSVLEQLNQGHRGKIYYDKQKLAAVKVTAVVPLNDTKNAMQLLQNALPQLSIKNVGDYIYWVSLTPLEK